MQVDHDAVPNPLELQSFGAWLSSIASSKARDRGLRFAVRPLIIGSRPADKSGAQTAADPARATDQTTIERARFAELDCATSGLPSRLKEALLLTAIDGRLQQEAGEILGVAAKTIETRVYRARKALTQALEPSIRDQT